MSHFWIVVMLFRFLMIRIVCFFGYCLLTSLGTACSRGEKTIHAEYKALTEAVYASGNVIPKNEYKVYVMTDGIITKKFVEEGSKVEVGQILFQLDNEEQAARDNAARQIFQTAQSNYGENSPALQELAAQLSSARAKFRNDSLQFARNQDLFASNSLTRTEFDRSTLAFSTSQNELTAAQRRYESRKRQLFVDLQNAQSQYRVNAKQDANFSVRSTTKGVVYEVYREAGEVVRRNEAVALLGDGEQVCIKLSVDELDINKIKVGQEVLVKIDVYKGRNFKASITKIYPMLNKQDQSFRVDAEFVRDSTNFLPASFVGLSVEANIIIAQKDRALVLPKTLVGTGDSVLIKVGSGSQKIKIRKGVENFEWVEVLAGIDENSAVVTK